MEPRDPHPATQSASAPSWAWLLLPVVWAVAAIGAAGFYYARRLRAEAFDVNHERQPDRPFRVRERPAGKVVLEIPDPNPDPRVLAPGTWGLDAERGYGQLGDIAGESRGTLTRAFRPLSGDLAAGDMVRVDNFAWRGSPDVALGLPCREVTYPTDLGPAPAWFVPGSNDTWAVFLHGKGASPEEALRILSVVHELGCPALLLTYRNDPGAPASPTGRYEYGLTEWHDLAAAVAYAREGGARRVVVFGYSLGAAIAFAALRYGPLELPVAAVIADSPMIDFRATVRHQAAHRGLPRLFTEPGMWVARTCFGVDWRALNYHDVLARVSVPVLLLQGDVDDRIPVAECRRAARRNPGVVRLAEFIGAGHVQSWNRERDRYESEVRRFLQSVMPAG